MQNSDENEPNQALVLPIEKKSIKYYKQIIPVNIHHFYIVDKLEDVDPYLDLINILKTAEPHDSIFIYINSPGGDLNTTIQIMSAIKQSDATVHTCIEGLCASAATLIFLSGHKFIVNPNSTFMIHNYSNGIFGKGNEMALQVKYQEEYFKQLAKDIYGSFLTESELKDMLDGKDLWFSSETVIKRLKTIEMKNNQKNEEVIDKSPKKKISNKTKPKK